MNREKLDRRVRTTRKLLRQGLFQLLSEKRLRDITVKELCERVDVNRGTFYLHYHDVYDLFSQIEEEIYHEIKSSLQRHEPGDFGDRKKVFPIFAEIFDYLVENYQICAVLLGENRDQAFFDRLTNIGRTDIVSS